MASAEFPIRVNRQVGEFLILSRLSALFGFGLTLYTTHGILGRTGGAGIRPSTGRSWNRRVQRAGRGLRRKWDCSFDMVTADRRFYNGLVSSPHAKHLLWIEDLPKNL